METLFTVERRIRRCKTCHYSCGKKPPIVGSESIYVPVPQRELFGKTYNRWCSQRVWFDENYFPVNFYRWPTEQELETLSHEEWEVTLARELKKIQAEATKT